MSNGTTTRTRSQRRQGIFWIFTIPHHGFHPYLPPSTVWIKGQLELAASGFLHWQFICAFTSKKSLAAVREVFGDYHAELTRSEAAAEYVWKDDTYVTGTRFELGSKPIRVNQKTDWEEVWTNATTGDFIRVPPHARILCYHSLRSIFQDNGICQPMDRKCYVYWGATNTGKSRRAWQEAGMEAYPKDPRSKFWFGYQSQAHVVLDEFRGGIDVAHMLRWLDRYPVYVEIKGASRPLVATTFWITSNRNPREWYPELDTETLSALLRRMDITHFHSVAGFPQ